jgi:hypothetical protein
MTEGTARLEAYVRGIGLLAPGLADWPLGAAVLRGERPHTRAPMELPAPAALPSAERRRTGATVRLALAAGLEALHGSGLEGAGLATVFASSGGDGAICHEICSALATPERQISPTRFHNSVHNAASGYWSIALGATASSTALAAYDGSFAAGLLEALSQLAATGRPVLLVAYETDYPEPLRTARSIAAPFATALLLDTDPGARAAAHLQASLTGQPADTLPEPSLEALRAGVPAARALPLLRRIARRDSGRAVLDYLHDLRLAVNVSPCQ